jgi:hypothetical protein
MPAFGVATDGHGRLRNVRPHHAGKSQLIDDQLITSKSINDQYGF